MVQTYPVRNLRWGSNTAFGICRARTRWRSTDIERYRRARRKADEAGDDPIQLADILYSLRDEAQSNVEVTKRKLDDFMSTHEGKSFKVFRPEDIDVAFTGEFEPFTDEPFFEDPEEKE